MCMRDAIYSSGGAVILMMALRLPLFCARACACLSCGYFGGSSGDDVKISMEIEFLSKTQETW